MGTTYDMTNWEWSWGHAGQTLLDAVGLLPVLGAIKYGDEAAALVKNGAKQVDEGAGPTKKIVDDVGEIISPKRIDVPDNLPEKIHLDQQGKHIPGHNNYIPGRSPLAEGIDPQKLLDGVHSGEYPIVRMTPRNQPVVDFGTEIGTYEGKPTQFGIIHSGKNGAHIVPANPVQY